MKNSMIIEYGTHARHFTCPYCSPHIYPTKGPEPCNESIPIFQSEKGAVITGGWEKRGKNWICPECKSEQIYGE